MHSSLKTTWQVVPRIFISQMKKPRLWNSCHPPLPSLECGPSLNAQLLGRTHLHRKGQPKALSRPRDEKPELGPQGNCERTPWYRVGGCKTLGLGIKLENSIMPATTHFLFHSYCLQGRLLSQLFDAFILNWFIGNWMSGFKHNNSLLALYLIQCTAMMGLLKGCSLTF